ncbi:MAG TPA: hypothetical protein VGF89_09340 [Steroidobacteraceae bacterium]|jgi:hypothetical protein
MSEKPGKSAADQGKSGSTDPKGPGKVQGEGDYQAARRFREKETDFVAKADVDLLAHAAAPGSPKEARDLALAEDSGKDRSKGDDAADPGIMYPGRKSDPNR